MRISDWSSDVCSSDLNSEGEYAGVGGRVHGGLPLETGLDVAVFTRKGVERICRFACELAMSRPRKRLTVVTKSNAQRHGMVFWDAVCRDVLVDYPGLDVDFKLAAPMAAPMVTQPAAIPPAAPPHPPPHTPHPPP